MPVDTEYEFKVIKKWRKAVSLVQRRDGTFAICRYQKREERWREVLFFNDIEDLDEFLSEMDEGLIALKSAFIIGTDLRLGEHQL